MEIREPLIQNTSNIILFYDREYKKVDIWTHSDIPPNFTRRYKKSTRLVVTIKLCDQI